MAARRVVAPSDWMGDTRDMTPICTVPGCERSAYRASTGLCLMHSLMQPDVRERVAVPPVEAPKPKCPVQAPLCAVQGCGRNRYSASTGLCSTHYWVARRQAEGRNRPTPIPAKSAADRLADIMAEGLPAFRAKREELERRFGVIVEAAS